MIFLEKKNFFSEKKMGKFAHGSNINLSPFGAAFRGCHNGSFQPSTSYVFVSVTIAEASSQ